MSRVFLTAPRRVIAAFSLLACVATLSAACTSAGSPTPTATSSGTPNSAAIGGIVGGAATSTPSPGASGAAGGAVGGAPTSTPSPGSGGIGGIVGGAGSAPAASPKAQGGASTCLVRYLNASLGSTQGALGSVYVKIVFKNLNNAPCTLYGYPGVSLGAGTPVNQVGQPAGRDNTVASTVITLAPGGLAYALVRIVDALNMPASTCKPTPTTWLLVYPPNTSNLLYVPYNTTACSANVVTLVVRAVQPGNGG